MKAHANACCRRNGWATGGAIFTLGAVLMPKCPLCITAWLAVIGLSGLAAHIDPRTLWLVAALAVAGSSALLVHRISRWKETRP